MLTPNMRYAELKDSYLFNTITLLIALSLLLTHPAFKQLENGFLHSLRCVGARKVFSDFLHRERQIPVLRLFLLQHDTEDGIIIELTFAR